MSTLYNNDHCEECPNTYDMGGFPLGYHTKEVIEELGMDYDELKEKGTFL